MTNKLTDNPLPLRCRPSRASSAAAAALASLGRSSTCSSAASTPTTTRPSQHAQLAHAARPGARVFRRTDGHRRPGQPGHHLHRIRLWPHAHLQQRRHRSRMGQPPPRCRRRGAGPGYVRPVPGHRRQSGQRCRRRPPDSQHLRRSVRRHAGALVRPLRWTGAARSSPTSATSAPAPIWVSWASQLKPFPHGQTKDRGIPPRSFAF